MASHSRRWLSRSYSFSVSITVHTPKAVFSAAIFSSDPESVAEHSWRAALMALCLEQELPGVEMDRVIRMLLIHDLGEAVTGDIPTLAAPFREEGGAVQHHPVPVADGLAGQDGGLPLPQVAVPHMGEETVTIDLSRPVTQEEMDAAEEAANRDIWKDLPVRPPGPPGS